MQDTVDSLELLKKVKKYIFYNLVIGTLTKYQNNYDL